MESFKVTVYFKSGRVRVYSYVGETKEDALQDCDDTFGTLVECATAVLEA